MIDTQAFVHENTLPSPLEIERAKRAILQYLRSYPSHAGASGYTFSSRLIQDVGRELAIDLVPIATPDIYGRVEPDLRFGRAEHAVCEALQLLHAAGVLIGYGATSQQMARHFGYQNMTSKGGFGSVTFPAVHEGYRLAAVVRDNHESLLMNSGIYLADLQSMGLSSRATRCLQEGVDAFRRGLYLSATILVGAASESMWMQLGRLVRDKGIGTMAEVNKKVPNAAVVMEEAWNALTSHRASQLGSVFTGRGDQAAFKEHADTLRARRNYATHSESADEDEPLFTYDATGLLLLSSLDYFGKLQRLITFVAALP